jgi:hypothetical protein
MQVATPAGIDARPSPPTRTGDEGTEGCTHECREGRGSSTTRLGPIIAITIEDGRNPIYSSMTTATEK